jgi:hypothetical protein
MNTSINIKALATNKGRTALLFLLTVLMLVVSCPFKRLLQIESNPQAAAQSSVKWNSADRKVATYQTGCSCAKKQKITLVKFEVNKQTLPASDFLADQNFQTGFSLHYFLSGLETQYSHSAFTSFPPLPLFLQHRRLLI